MIFFFTKSVTGQTTGDDKKNLMPFTIKGNWFMAYQDYIDENRMSLFKLKRGYLTVEKQLNDIFTARYTQDITIDEEGDDAGNVELRFKYCYLRTHLPSFSIFTHSFIEAGIVHRPLIDFEQKINDYRVQSKMFLERAGIISSADFGLTFVTLLGGEMAEEYQKNVSKSYPGKFGSFAFGVYNGGDYHSLEMNNNKTIEGRLSLRPFPEKISGLQFSYNFAYGKGNDSISSDFQLNSFFVSNENLYSIVTAQYYWGVGGKSGGEELAKNGYSFFGEFLIPKTKLAIFGRYDFFDTEIANPYQNIIGGISYYFYKKNKILFDIDWSNKENELKRIYEVALRIKF